MEVGGETFVEEVEAVEDAGMEAEAEEVGVTEVDKSESDDTLLVDSEGVDVGEVGVVLSCLVVAADVFLAAADVLVAADVFGSAEVLLESLVFAVGVALFLGVVSAVAAGTGLSTMVLGALSGSSFCLSSIGRA